MVSVRVPATTANLGPGFDCLGAALGLYARFHFEETEEGLEVSGCEPAFAGPDNLVYRAFANTLERFGETPRGLRLRIDSAIPPARGLGSSAACVVGGILGARALWGLPLQPEEVFALAAGMEGHPDNAAAAVFGGLRVAMAEGGNVFSLPAPVHPGIRFLALVPDFPLETETARRALPERVTRADAVYNLSHTALLLRALEAGDTAMVRAACGDRLHQPWRFPLIPGGRELAQRMEGLGAMACLISGAGPSLLCLYTDPAFPSLAGGLLSRDFPRFRALPLALCLQGAAAERA